MDNESNIQRFIDLTQISGRSGDERSVADRIVEILMDAGLSRAAISFDKAEQRTRLSGNCGNLIIRLPGNSSGCTTMLSAHMDTVPICIGSRPMIQGDEVLSSETTGLGADDRSGCAAILTAALKRIELGDENFPPAVLAFFVQEEVGLQGAQHLDVSKIGSIDRAFNFDGGSPDKITHGAIGGERMTIRVKGIPAHAGVAPEKGVNAITIASIAISNLHANGWLGKIVHDIGEGTANIGVINGGEATNVVTPEAELRAEARSHDPAVRTRIVSEIRGAFETATTLLSNDTGESGSIEFDSNVDYESFRLNEDHPSIVKACEALELAGRKPFCEVANGGLDANWLFRHGIEAVTLGCGQRNIHTVNERLNIPDYLTACQVATWLITDGAS